MTMVDEMKGGQYMAEMYNNLTLCTCNPTDSITTSLFLT